MFYSSGDSSAITAMGNTFSCLNVHCVFSTKERVPILNPEVRERLWLYLGGTSGTSEQINRPFGTGSTFILFPGTSCQATFVWSLRDGIHSFIVGFP